MSSELANMGDERGLQDRPVILRKSECQIIERNATRGRPITPEERDMQIVFLKATLDCATASRRTKISASRALTALESLDLRDLHHRERIDQENGIMRLKQERAEAGLPNDSVALILPPVRQMPMPDWMIEMKKAKGAG